ncbi:CopG family ribbon-helix-helix protein [Natronorubrum halophilum]|uniref:CopG family ribbon-helix-helix protein n=1 Tax=Natronorubrum halophilum TaxID=1702106 RepID=UPI0030843CB0
MPAKLIEHLDNHAAEHDYTGRSEVVRESARTLLTEFDGTRLKDEALAGVVSVCYDFGVRRHASSDRRHRNRRLLARAAGVGQFRDA